MAGDQLDFIFNLSLFDNTGFLESFQSTLFYFFEYLTNLFDFIDGVHISRIFAHEFQTIHIFSELFLINVNNLSNQRTKFKI